MRIVKSLLVSLLSMLIIFPVFAADRIGVEVDGTPVVFEEQAPYADEQSRVLVPFRTVLEQMGAEVSWDDANRTVTVDRDGTAIVFTMDSEEYSVDGEVLSMDTIPAVQDGHVYLPIRYAAEALGDSVRWNPTEYCVEIFSGLIPAESPGEEDSFGSTIEVFNVDDLRNAVEAANQRGDTRILVAEGDYALEDMLYVTAAGVSVVGATGDRNDVVIHGPSYQIFGVEGDDFYLKDLSIGDVETHAVQVHGEADADQPHFENVRFFNTGEQMLKISYEEGNPAGSDQGVIEDCLFEYTDGVGPKWYIGGVDAHQASGWIIRGNRFKDIRSPEEDLAEHAVHFWSGSSDTVVEKNVIINCDRGIGFGLGDRGHHGGRISNNMIYTSRDVGIGLESADGAQVLNNTIWTENYDNSIEYRFPESSGIVIANNLCSGIIAERDGASAITENNLEMAEASWFMDPYAGDLHLNALIARIVDQGQSLSEIADDIDGTERPQGEAFDLGADEWM